MTDLQQFSCGQAADKCGKTLQNDEKCLTMMKKSSHIKATRNGVNTLFHAFTPFRTNVCFGGEGGIRTIR